MKFEWNKVTWYSKLLAFAFFVALPIAGFYLGILCGAARQQVIDYSVGMPSGNAAPAAASSSSQSQNENAYYKDVAVWQTDANNSGWSIAYPLDFDIADNYAATPVDDWRAGTPSGSGLKLFTLTIPRAFEPQTNFADAVLNVGASDNAAAVEHCLVADPTGGQENAASTTTLNGVPFTVFNFSDVGAGNYYETTSYRTLRAGKCYAVEYTIHSSQIMNYPPEYQLKPFDEAEVKDVLDRIVGTFKFQ